MNVGIIGLGLIGGSLAKGFKRNTKHTVLGFDIADEVNRLALYEGTIDGILNQDALPVCDIVIIALYPKEAMDYLSANAAAFSKKGIVTDICGVKQEICALGERLGKENGFYFIGGHPMAGKEIWGYSSSSSDLFEGASFILTPSSSIPENILKKLEDLYLSLHIQQITLASPEEHDQVIAYTSQLAHILSSSYIKSPTAQKHSGYSAGSFKDLTRVSGMNEKMWTDLFLMNKRALLKEIDIFLEHLEGYKKMICEENKSGLLALVKEGNQIRESLY